MRDALNLVRGAVAKKSMLPVLTYFRLYNGRVQGSNGRLSIDAPCPGIEGLDACVPAERFLKAVDACDGEPRMRLTDGGKLSVSRGSFRALLPTIPPADYPLAEHGDLTPAIGMGDWLPALRALAPFIGEDASKQWAMGIWLAPDGHGYATNNTALARIPVPWSATDEPLIMPGFLAEELLRLGLEPDGMSYGDGAIVVDLPGGAWIRSRLIEGQFPDSVRGMIPDDCAGVNSADVLAAVRRVRPFCPSTTFPRIILRGDGVLTEEGEMSAHVGGMALPDSKWHADVLELMLANADEVDFSQVPCPFKRSDGLVGIGLPLRA